ncbi:MAG: hypothetical protein HYX32_03300 [Actinobacteria bacterium]|nr:hypothetical protein [Actinomycetota bacterium]
MGGRVKLTYDGPVATITNDNPDKHNAFDDDMDQQLFAAFAELRARQDVRAVIWRGEGKSFGCAYFRTTPFEPVSGQFWWGGGRPGAGYVGVIAVER